MSNNDDKHGLDLIGLGRIAEAIPPKVYEQSADVLLQTFQDLTAPITATTNGFGRYLRQKFDNMVFAEKAIATYTVEKALKLAKAKSERLGNPISPPPHPKSFIKSIEEASKETDPVLHEMWANLLSSQLIAGKCHPHFVEVLPHFSPAEARILTNLLPKKSVGPNEGAYLSYEADSFTHWVQTSEGEEFPWTHSCDLLLEFRCADLLAPVKKRVTLTLLYRTSMGDAFLSAVSST